MYNHDCHKPCNEPPKRETPTYCGKVDTAKMGEYYSAHAPHHCHPHCGYEIPPLKPLFVPGMSPQEQTQLIASRVDELTKMLNEYNCKVWGAYEEIVNSAICNDAYYSEIISETGYISATSAKYTVVHIPFIDRGGEPIYLELGLAYDNTTNSGIKESVFDESERKIADKLIPAFNIADGWNGKARYYGAPIPSNEGKFTLGVSRNGFIKIYNNSATETDMNKDDIFCAMGVQGVLVSGGKKAVDSYDENTKDKLIGRVGIGMNYDTQERFFILVDGSGATGVESGGGCTSDQLAEIFTKYGCTVAVEVANGDSTCMLDKGELVNIPYDTGVTRTPTNEDGGKIPYVPRVNCFWYISKERHYHNDYVREVGELMQKYGRSIWQGIIDEKAVNALKAEVQNMYVELSKEITERKDADSVLQENINTLDTRVTTLYNELVESDRNLDNKISQLRTDLETETQERKDADSALQVGVGEAKTLIEQEVTARANGDEANKQLIDKEIADRKTADSNMDKALKALINAESEARASGDENLATQIADVINKFNAFKSKTESDITQIDSDLDTLTASINALSTTVNNNEIDIETKVTNLTARVSANETTTADNVEKIAKINAQINALQTTVSALNETVTALQASFASTEQSFENVKQTVANMQSELNTFEETINAKFGEYLPLIGGKMKGNINMGGKGIFNIYEVVFDNGVTLSDTEIDNKRYVSFESDTQKIPVKAGDAVDPDELVTKSQMENADANYLPLTGGTMTGKIVFDGTKFVDPSVGFPTSFMEVNFNGVSSIKFTPLELDMKDLYIIAGKHVNYAVTMQEGGEPEGFGFALEHWKSDEGDGVKLSPVTYSDDGRYEFPDTRLRLSIADGLMDSDAVTKKQLDAVNPSGKYLPLTGGTMTGDIDLAQQSIKNAYEIGVTDAGETHDVKFHVNDDGSLTVGAYNHGETNGNNARVQIADATSEHDAVSKGQLDKMLPLSGGTMTGDVNMNNHKITNVNKLMFGADESNDCITGMRVLVRGVKTQFTIPAKGSIELNLGQELTFDKYLVDVMVTSPLIDVEYTYKKHITSTGYTIILILYNNKEESRTFAELHTNIVYMTM